MEEPTFTIRAQDALGPSTVEAWAILAEIAAKATGATHLHDQAAEARTIAEMMRKWQSRNMERVKWPD